MKSSLDEILSFLVSGRGRTHTFYPVVINNFTKIPSPGMGTMGVTVNSKGGQELRYDPALLEALHFDGLKIILIHEVYHIVLQHIPRMLRLLANTPEDKKHQVFTSSNLAADYAVNSLLVKTRECSLRDLKEGMGEYAGVYPTDLELPEGKSYEWYMERLMELCDNKEEMIRKGILKQDPNGDLEIVARGASRGSEEPEEGEGEGEGTSKAKTVAEALSDYHEKNAPTSNHKQVYEEIKGMTSDEMSGHADKVDRKNKKAVRKAVDNSSAKARGTLPGSFKSLLDEYLKPPSIPWERFLRTWLTNTRKTRVVRSMRRPKRRLFGQPGACVYPGSKRDPKYHILFAIDSSGSMREEDLQDALSELRGVQKSSEGVKITVVECDTAIQAEYTVGPNSELDFNIRGRGGTTFDPVFVRAKDLKPDAILYVTDGYAPLPALENRVNTPVLWVISKGGVAPGAGYSGRRDTTECDYGRVIRIERN